MRQHEKPHKSCGTSAARLATRARVAFGRPVKLHGLLMSSAGLPIAGQPVAILTRSGQRLERVHTGRGGDHGRGWQLDGNAAARSVADHRGLIPGLADDPARHRVRDRDHARPRSC